MEFRRRQVLRAGALAALGSAAGCLGGRDSGGTPVGTGTSESGRTTTVTSSRTTTTGGETPTMTTRTTTRVSPLGTTRTALGTNVTVTDVLVRDSVIASVAPDAFGVLDGFGDRFVFVRVETDPDMLDHRAFEFVTDRRRYRPGAFLSKRLKNFEQRYRFDPHPDRGWFAVQVPAPLKTASATVAVGDAAWKIPDRHVWRLGQPKPTFELVSFSVPDAVDPNEKFEVATTFHNAGDQPGTLRAMLLVQGGGFPYHVGRSTAIEIPAGERRTWRESFGPRAQPGRGDVVVRLDYPGGGVEQSIPVNQPTATGTTTGGE